MSETVEVCEGCGLAIASGTAGCQAIMDELTARGFSDASYGRVHRLFVDTYCLQHPDPYCVSFKSFAAHLTGVCWTLEYGGSPGTVSEALRKWDDWARSTWSAYAAIHDLARQWVKAALDGGATGR